ncbi:MAG: glycosyltransferase family 39 protein [Bdellovibrio bacteriovorus]
MEPAIPALRVHDAWRPVLVLIGVVTLWRVLMAWLVPVTQDEAYYFDWARHLAWGYFDHPPGVALLGLGTWLAPSSALAARLGGVLAGALTLVVLARLYRNSGIRGESDLTLALVIAVGTLPGLAGGFLTTPDSALALGWALALHESERALAGQRRRWLTAGLAVGIGLLGKYTMVVMGPVLLWAILRADPRALRTPWPYLGGLVALLVLAPNLVWNAQNEWLTLRFQLGHGFAADSGALMPGTGLPDGSATIERSGHEGLAEGGQSLLGYLGSQLALWGLLALPLLWVSWLAWRGAMAPQASPLSASARSLLQAATWLPLGFFALVSLRSDVEANWPLMYLLAAPPLLVPVWERIRGWVAAAALGNLLLVSLYGIHAATRALPLPEGQNRILRETHGFAELAAAVAGLDAPVYADRYQDTAMLRFYAPGITATQWPGLTRPSEYLRGKIAPRVGPTAPEGPFWLITRGRPAPEIPGAAMDARRILVDCPGEPLAEGAEPPCARPLHVWSLYHYRTDGPWEIHRQPVQ